MPLPVLTGSMEPSESDDFTSSEAAQSASLSREDFPRAVVEEHLYLLDNVPHIDDTPKELNETVGSLLDILTNAYALAIIYQLFCEKRPLRFNELEDTLGVSPKVLSQRLKELAEAELVSRHSYDEIPPRVEYEPTAKAEALDPAFQFLYAWAAHYGSE